MVALYQEGKIEDRESLVGNFFELTKNIRATKVDVVDKLIKERKKDVESE